MNRRPSSATSIRVRAPSASRKAVQPRNIKLHSRRETLELVDRQSRALLGVTRAKAFRMLDRGELSGTVAEAQLELLRSLLAT
jgi:hypothetical protein